MTTTELEDRFGRHFPYLRLSVTEACNFRCGYCLPDGYRRAALHDFLSVSEIAVLAEAFAGLGVRKIRLTGGEPTLRRDLPQIIRTIAGVPGISSIALTTNGYRLKQDLDEYVAAGLTALNISIDSLSPERFKAITGHDRLADVLEAVEMAEQAGLSSIKINTVLLRGTNDDELPGFVELVRNRVLSARFIELMRTGDNADYFQRHHADPATMIETLLAQGWTQWVSGPTDGPAKIYRHPGYQGCLGFIAPYARDFCASCNRLRISARGGLQLCLFGDGIFDLRRWLQDRSDIPELQTRIASLLGLKEASHALADGHTGRTRRLAMIGG